MLVKFSDNRGVDAEREINAVLTWIDDAKRHIRSNISAEQPTFIELSK